MSLIHSMHVSPAAPCSLTAARLAARDAQAEDEAVRRIVEEAGGGGVRGGA
jgi:hypothetical protein